VLVRVRPGAPSVLFHAVLASAIRRRNWFYRFVSYGVSSGFAAIALLTKLHAEAWPSSNAQTRRGPDRRPNQGSACAGAQGCRKRPHNRGAGRRPQKVDVAVSVA